MTQLDWPSKRLIFGFYAQKTVTEMSIDKEILEF